MSFRVSRIARLINFNSVRGRLAFLVIALTCASLVTGLILVVRAYQQANAAVSRQLIFTARALTIGVDVHLRQYIRMLETLASMPEIRSGDIQGSEKILRNISMPGNVWISFANNQGDQFINTSLPPGAPIPKYKIDLDFRQAMQRGEIFISNFEVGALKRPILFISVPVNSGSHILGIALDPDSFSANLSLRRMAGENIITILDRKGVIAARSRNPETLMGKSASPSFWKDISDKKEGVLETVNLDGTRVLTSFRKSDLSGWIVVNSAAHSVAYAAARKLLLVAGVLSGLLLLVVFLFTRWIGQSLVDAVNSIVNLSTEIGRGTIPKFETTGLAETDRIAQSLRSAGEQLIAHERDLHELNQTLKHRIQTRTHQLISTNQELAATNRELEDFARVSSHDLREPLRTINGFASSLCEDFHDLPVVARNYTRRISSAAQRMHDLLESIFAYSRISDSHRVVESVDLNQVLNDVCDDLESRLAETGGKVSRQNLANVSGNHREVHQLLLNLVANGLKFRREGIAPLIKVETFEAPDHVRLVVSDNGIGFDPNLAERLFVPFQRLENASRFEGTGMGLAIVRKLAERNGGSVRAVGTPGRGSRFEVVFKLTNVPHLRPLA